MILPIRRVPALLVPLLFALLLAGGPAAADETFDKTPLGDYLLLGTDGAWSGELTDNAYRLTNASEPNAAKYLYVDVRGGSTPSWDISVEVRIESGDKGIAGLIYALQREPLSYLALVIEASGKASLYSRSPKGLQLMAPFEKAKLIPDGFNTLRIVEGAGEFQVLINGDKIATAKTEMAGSGALGIFAGGQGQFLFRNFALVPVEGPPAVSAAPAEPAAATPTAGASDAAEPTAADPAAAAPPDAATQPETPETAPDLPLPPTPPSP